LRWGRRCDERVTRIEDSNECGKKKEDVDEEVERKRIFLSVKGKKLELKAKCVC
jgi:hypothetical protein